MAISEMDSKIRKKLDERIQELEARVSLAVDVIIIRGNGFVVIERKSEPFKGQCALPGGFVEPNETTEQAAIREAKEETGLDISIVKLVGVYSNPGRDPRKSVVSICYMAIGSGKLEAGDDAADVKVIPKFGIPRMAFDHNQMLIDAKIYEVL